MKEQLALGEFVFSLGSNITYEQLFRQSTGGWVNVDITNAKALSHNTGLGLQTINLNGKVFGGHGMTALDKLRTLQANRQPQTLIDALGNNLGRWKLMDITETQKRIIDDGTAMVIEFQLSLEEFADESR